jgi:Uma2 family endonuclease
MLDPAILSSEQLRPLRAREYLRLVEAGAFGDEKLELLGGFLVVMSPQKGWHAKVVALLHESLVLQLRGRALVRSHSGLEVTDDSVPEPDLAVVKRGGGWRHPRWAYLVVEAAESSLRKDRTIKAAFYAAGRIPEYWVVDRRHRAVHVHTRPDPGARRYRAVRVAEPGELLRPTQLRGVTVAIADLFPPRRRR